MASDDQKTSRNQAINHVLKSGCFELLFIISEEVVSQEDEMKIPIWGVMQDIMETP